MEMLMVYLVQTKMIPTSLGRGFADSLSSVACSGLVVVLVQ